MFSSLNRQRFFTISAAGACAWMLAGTPLTAVYAQQRPAAAEDGVYTDSQAARGQDIYKLRCAGCHGVALQGGAAPPLAGDGFVDLWGGPLSDLANKIRNTMPANEAGTLTPQQSADIVAYLLKVGKFPAGKTELVANEETLKAVAMTRSQKPPALQGKTGTAQAPTFPPAGNLAAVMRGMLFPTSNLIFNVQTNDPGAPLPARASGSPPAGGFSWVDWGAGIYSPWELVDYAAIAVAESAPLMLTPGRRCENGRPVPVDRPDWIKYSLELAEAGRAAYKASQSRNQEAVSEATNQLSDSCANCHRAYRDTPRGREVNVADPSNKAARCLPRTP